MLENDAKHAAKEFFQEATEDTINEAHSVYEGKTILFFDYTSVFESYKEKSKKVSWFLETLNLGGIGTQARNEFMEEQDTMIMDDQNDTHHDDEDGLANLEMGDWKTWWAHPTTKKDSLLSSTSKGLPHGFDY